MAVKPFPAFADMARAKLEAIRSKQDREARTAASIAEAKKRTESKKLSNTERRALLKQLFAREQEP